METNLLPPDIRRDVKNLWEEVRALKRRVGQAPDTARKLEVVFSRAGEPAISSSPAFWIEEGGRAKELLLGVKTTGVSGTLTVRTYKGGVLFGDAASLAAGSTVVKVNLGRELFQPDQDGLSVGITSAGVGFLDVTVQVRFV